MNALHKFSLHQALDHNAMKRIVGGVEPTRDNRNIQFDSGMRLGLDGAGYQRGSHTVTIRPDSIPPRGFVAEYTLDLGRNISEKANKGERIRCTIL